MSVETVDLPFSDAEAPGTPEEEAWVYPTTEGLSEEEAAEQMAEAEAVVAAASTPAAPAAPSPATAAAPVTAAPTATVHTISPFGKFEGLDVSATSVKLNGEAKVESLAGIHVSIDDRVRLVGEFKCVGVSHKPNKDGEIVREMIFKASNLELAPWDPADPTDDGILRARPLQP